MTRKSLWRAGVALSMMAALWLPGAGAIAQDEAPAPVVVAEGFNAPQGVLVAPDGSIWVADSGVGGDEVITGTDPATSEPVTITVGNTARIVQVMPDGTQNVAAELPSFNAGFDTAGAARLALLNDELYATTGWWAPMMGDEPGPNQAVIVKVGEDEVTEVAKLWRTEKRMNPDNAQIDSHPYGLVSGPDGKLWVVDAGGNDLLRVDPAANSVEWLSTFAPIEGVFPNPNLGGEMLTDAVPTGIAFDEDGNAYISLLGGAPFVPGTSKVVKVGPNGGAPADFATGLTMLTDIKRAPDGNLYAVQIGEFTDQGPVPDSGQIIHIVEGEGSTPVVSGLSFPTSIDFTPNGDAYVTINGVGPPGTGAVVMLAGLGGPGAEGEAEAEAEAGAQPEEESTAAETPSVAVEDQESDGSQVTVASVDAPANAWLAIASDADGKPGQVLGATAVPAGTTENVVVIFDEPIAGENHLWAILHEDAGEAGVWEYPDGPDVPMMAGDEMVMAPFTATAPGGETAEAPAEGAAAAEATPEPAEEGTAAEAAAQPAEEAAAAPAQMPATGAAGMGGLTSIAVVTMVLAGLAVGTFAVRRRKA